jgi:hypothetical protein
MLSLGVIVFVILLDLEGVSRLVLGVECQLVPVAVSQLVQAVVYQSVLAVECLLALVAVNLLGLEAVSQLVLVAVNQLDQGVACHLITPGG